MNFHLEPNPFEPVDLNTEPSDWIDSKIDHTMKKKEKFTSSPIRKRVTTIIKLQESNAVEENNCQNEHDESKKDPFFTCVASSYDDTASTLSMSVTSDEKSSEKSDHKERFQPDQEQDANDIYIDSYLAGLEKSTMKTQTNDHSETKNTNRTSPFYDRLAIHETKSISLRRTSSSRSDQTRAKNSSRRLSRDPSPLHERLATQHTYATESKLSCKIPEAKKTVPFFNVVRSESFNGTEVASISMLPNASPSMRPRRDKDPSPLHERLSNHHTLSSIQKQKQLRAQIARARNPPPKPFYTVVAGSSNASTDDVSALTKPSFRTPTPPRTSTRYRNIPIPPAPRYASTKKTVIDELVGNGRARSSTTPRTKKTSTFSSDARRTLQQRRSDLKDKQDALYHRLSRQDTVASSRMKPIPLDGKILSSYEKKKKASETPKRNRSQKNEVYDRLMNRGTKASLRKQMLNANPRYANGQETFSEGCKNFLMRDFKGSTFVRV